MLDKTKMNTLNFKNLKYLLDIKKRNSEDN